MAGSRSTSLVTGRCANRSSGDGPTGATPEDTDGLINMPLMASEIQAVALIRTEANGDVRVSLRSKGATDVRLVAAEFGGGGHTNAAGFTRRAEAAVVRREVVDRLARALVAAPAPARG